MNTIVPSKIFLTKGMGQHKEKLASLEIALREAGIAPYPLVKITSIFPPKWALPKLGSPNWLSASAIWAMKSPF